VKTEVSLIELQCKPHDDGHFRPKPVIKLFLNNLNIFRQTLLYERISLRIGIEASVGSRMLKRSIGTKNRGFCLHIYRRTNLLTNSVELSTTRQATSCVATR
jgi:hypothetical protein